MEAAEGKVKGRRPNKDVGVALERAVALLPVRHYRGKSTSVLITGKTATLTTVGMSGGRKEVWMKEGTKIQLLAMVADILFSLSRQGEIDQSAEEIREIVKWSGRIPSKGLASWQETALDCLSLSSRREEDQ